MRGRPRSESLALACAFFAALQVAALSPPAPVGPLPGSFAVSDTGAATYQIPLTLPPGIGDAVPQLAIVYSSQAGDGLLGMGFMLHGLSSITRCAANAALAGTPRGIDFSGSDWFCLDGKTLVPIGSGRYRLEEEEFTRIESFGTAGTGPEWFRVTTADGIQREFGRAPSGRIAAQGLPPDRVGSIRVYALTKLIDLSGNYFTVDYAGQPFHGDYQPTGISYTGNDSAGQAPRVRVDFAYRARLAQDAARITRQIGLAYTRTTQKLTGIRISILGVNGSWSVVHEYRLRYETELTERSRTRLAGVTECSGIQGVGICRPETSFTWADGGLGVDSNFSTEPEDHLTDLFDQDFSASSPFPGDFDGDGVSDLYMIADGDSYFCSGRQMVQSQSCTRTYRNTNWRSNQKLYTGDFDGDGRADFLLAANNRASQSIAYGSSLVTAGNPTSLAAGWNDGNPILVGDFTGDGRSDLFHVRNGSQQLCPGESLTSGTPCRASTVHPGWATHKLLPGDYNGDGITDVIAAADGQATFCDGRELSAPGSMGCTTFATSGSWRTDYDVYPGDYNGDGYEDLYLIGSAMTLFCAGPNVSISATCARTDNGTENWRVAYDFYLGDYNGDGVTDVARVNDDTIQFCAGPRVSQSLQCIIVVYQSGLRSAAVGVIPGDFTGDSVPDFLVMQAGTKPGTVTQYVCNVNSISSTRRNTFNGTTGNGTAFTATYDFPFVMTLTSPVPDANRKCRYAGSRPAVSQTVPAIEQPLTVGATIEITQFGGNRVWCHPATGTVAANVDLYPYPYGPVTYNNQGTWRYTEQAAFLYDGFRSTAPGHLGSPPICPCWCDYVGVVGGVVLNAPAFSDSQLLDATPVTVNVDVPTIFIRLAQGRTGPIDVIERFRVGLGGSLVRDTSVRYATLTNTGTAVYTRGTGSVWPLREVQQPQFVVERVTQDDGRGSVTAPGSYFLSYQYANLRSDLRRRESLGFERITITDSRPDSLRTVREFRQDGLLAGREKMSSSYLGTILVSRSETVWRLIPSDACNVCFHPLAERTIERSYELNGLAASTTTRTLSTFGTYGGPRFVTVQFDNLVSGQLAEYVRTTETTYFTDSNLWVLERPETITDSGSGPLGAGPTRTTHFGYDLRGRPEQIDWAVGSPVARTTTMQRDARGLVSLVVERDTLPDTPDRSSITRFDAFGLPDQIENALGHVIDVDYEPKFGLLERRQEPNGVAATASFDAFGRVVRRTVSGGADTSVSYGVCVTGCPFPEARLHVTTWVGGSLPRIDYLDAVGRNLGNETTDSLGRVILQHKRYDPFGRLTVESRPYFEGAAPAETLTSFDAHGRIRELIVPGPGTAAARRVVLAYAPLAVTETTPDPGDGTRVTTRNYDSASNIARVTDSNQQTTRYGYTIYGELARITDPANNVTSYDYDAAGNLAHKSDPSSGQWTFASTAFGETALQRSDRTGRTVTTTYDAAGRIATRTDRTQGVYGPVTWTWRWDVGTCGLGRLEEIFNGPEHAKDHRKMLFCDGVGRPNATVTLSRSLAGQIEGGWTLLSYDEFGRLTTQQFPNLIVTNTYASDGTLERIAGGGTTLWQAVARDSELRVTDALLANGLATSRAFDPLTGRLLEQSTGNGAVHRMSYGFDVLGNLRTRRDRSAGRDVTEVFGYDRLNRLTSSKFGSAPTLFNAYDSLGNLRCLGTRNQSNCAGGGGVVLGYSGTGGPHGVTSAGQTPISSLNTNGEAGAFSASYFYDLDGFQSERSAEDDTTSNRFSIADAFGRPLFVQAGQESSLSFFGPDGEVLRQRYVRPGSVLDVYRPVDGYEQWTDGTNVHQRVTLRAPDGTRILYVGPAGQAFSTTNLRFVHADVLGSAAVITGPNGAVLEARGFDPFGRGRDPATAALVTPPELTATETPISFTGQRSQGKLNLYDYGARWYDPTIGRFLQPDPVIPNPYDPQSLNRFSYVLNNPLTYVDPTGQSPTVVVMSSEDVETILYSIAAAMFWGPGVLTTDGYYVPDSWESVARHHAMLRGGARSSSSSSPGSSATATHHVTTTTYRPSTSPTRNRIVTASADTSVVGSSTTVSENIQAFVDEVVLHHGFSLQQGMDAAMGFLEGIGVPEDEAWLRVAQARERALVPRMIGMQGIVIGAKMITDLFSGPKPRRTGFGFETMAEYGLKPTYVTRPVESAGAQTTVIGRFPDYVRKADELNAARFNVAPEVWNALSEESQRLLNKRFMDQSIRRGDEIILSNPAHEAPAGSSYEREIHYYESQGIRPSFDETRMVR